VSKEEKSSRGKKTRREIKETAREEINYTRQRENKRGRERKNGHLVMDGSKCLNNVTDDLDIIDYL